jgi:hypothetical protein
MSEETAGLDAQIEGAKRRLQEATEAAEAAERRAVAEILALEANLEKERLAATQAVEELKAMHEEELKRERAAREQAIEAAERRAAEAERSVAEREAGAREAAAAWLRGQIEAIGREAGR